MWGDFYAKSGGGPGEEVYVYNTGFGSDTNAPISNGNALADGKAWLLVSDTETVVPIPGALWLLCSGLLGLVAVRRRLRK